MKNSLVLNSLIQKQSFRFRKEILTKEFIESLNQNDLFSFHCRNLIEYLGFKKCDKKFREIFNLWLTQNNISYVVTNMLLTEDRLYNFFNAKKIVLEQLDEPCYPWGGETWRQLYNRLIESGSKSTFQELVDDQALIIKNLSSIEIKEDKQKLSGGFDSGCWLIFWKN